VFFCAGFNLSRSQVQRHLHCLASTPLLVGGAVIGGKLNDIKADFFEMVRSDGVRILPGF